MSEHTILNNNNQVFPNMHMAERQSSTNTTCNPLAIDNNTIINNITIPHSQAINNIINVPLVLPFVLPAPPPPPAAFQIQHWVQPNQPNQPNAQQKLNPSAPTFTPNPFINTNLNPSLNMNNVIKPVQGYQNQLQIDTAQKQVQQSLGKLQILSIQLSTLQIINQQNPTVESLNQYQNVYQQYNTEFANTLLLNQYMNNLNNNNIIVQPQTVNKDNSMKKGVGQLETIAEGEYENENQNENANEENIEPIDKNEGTKNTKQIIGEQLALADTKDYFSHNATNPTSLTSVFGEQNNGKKSISELEGIKKQIRSILNKITAENFDKLSQEIASILKVSDIALIELKNSYNSKKNSLSNEELYMFEKAQFKALIKLILKCILEKAINEPLFSHQYGRLCYSLYLYAENNALKKKLFRQQLLTICHSMFKKTRQTQLNGSNGVNNRFIGIITMIGVLFTFGLVSWNVIYSGIFEELLPPQHSIDIEGVCKLLKTAGSDFDRHHYKEINIIIHSLNKYCEKFDFRSKCFVREIYEMRGNDWKQKKNIQRNVKPKPEIIKQMRMHKNKKTFNNNNRQWRNYNNNNNNNNNNNRYHPYYNNSYGSRSRKQAKNVKPTVEFVKDVTLPDRSHYAPNKILTKTWAMRNSGGMSWGDNVELVYFKGDKTLSLDNRYPVMNAQAGQEVQISAAIKTPQQPGRYCTYFRLQKNGKFFGPRVWVDIIVNNNNITQQTSIHTRKYCATNHEANNNRILSCQ